MYEEIISKLGPIFEKNISSSLAEIDFEREVRRRAACCVHFLPPSALCDRAQVEQPLPLFDVVCGIVC